MGLEHKVRIVTRDSCSDLLVKQNGLYVLVGVPSDLHEGDPDYDERNDLAELLKEKGLKVRKVDCYWPRDKFVWFKDTYVHNMRYFEEGGCFVFGNNYLLASAELNYDGRRSSESVEKQLDRLYHVPSYLVPSLRVNGAPKAHIDYTVSIIESRKLLLVDSRHYRQQKRLFERIAYEQSQRLVAVDSGEIKGALWPMNILVLDEGKKTTVVANSECRRLLRILNRHDIEIIATSFVSVPESNGSIRCATNTVGSMKAYSGIKACIYNETKILRKKE